MLAPSRPVLRAALACLTATALTSGALCAVIVVDDDGGPGIDFTDLPPAVAAASAGDVILVHPGSYTDFVLDKGVTILGLAPGVNVKTGTRVTGLPAGQRAVLADLQPRDLRVLSSAGTVVLESLKLQQTSAPGQPHLLEVDGSLDVRVRGSSLLGSTSGSLGGIDVVAVSASRFELVQSVTRGGSGFGTDCGAGGDGGLGLWVALGARAHLALSDVEGGEGGYVTYSCPALCNQGAGDGGDGLGLSGASVLYLMGQPANFVRGGFAGDGGACPCDGHAGDGLVVSASTAVWSGLSLQGGGAYCSGGGSPLVVGGNGSASQSVPPDPFLELQGAPAAGQPVRFTIWGQPGDQAILYLGRFPVVVALPGVEIEQLTTEERSFHLGTLPAAGNASFLLTVPSFLTTGFTFHGQGAVVRGSQELRTNSVAVVLR